MLQNTKTARMLVYNTQLQCLEFEGNVFHDQYPKVNLMFLFISFFKLSVISVSSSHSYFLTKWPKSSLSWLKKTAWCQTEINYLFLNNNRAYHFYCLKAAKTQLQLGWVGDVWFYCVVIHYLKIKIKLI